jgi:hypothetical protein
LKNTVVGFGCHIWEESLEPVVSKEVPGRLVNGVDVVVPDREERAVLKPRFGITLDLSI